MKPLELLKKPKSFIILFLVLALPVTLLMTKQVQDVRQRAQQPMSTPTPPQMTIACDLNFDNSTDVNDFTTLYYCATGSGPCTTKNRDLADINNTGKVDASDISRYSQTCVLNTRISPIPTAGGPTMRPSGTPWPTSTPIRTSPTLGGPTMRPSSTPIRMSPTPTRSLQPSPTISSATQKKIFGVVYVDGNKNGKKDWNEMGYGGAKITVQNSANRYICSTQTSSTGSYSCTIPAAGTYTTNLVTPQGYTVSSKNPVTLTIPQSVPSAGVTFSLTQ